MTIFNFKTGLAAAMLATSMTAVPAIAGEAGEVATAEVRYADLDLSTERGQNRLHLRMRSAAREVCGMDIREPGTTLPSREARECYVNKIAGFERQIASLARDTARGG